MDWSKEALAAFMLLLFGFTFVILFRKKPRDLTEEMGDGGW